MENNDEAAGIREKKTSWNRNFMEKTKIYRFKISNPKSTIQFVFIQIQIQNSEYYSAPEYYYPQLQYGYIPFNWNFTPFEKNGISDSKQTKKTAFPRWIHRKTSSLVLVPNNKKRYLQIQYIFETIVDIFCQVSIQNEKKQQKYFFYEKNNNNGKIV